MPNELTAARTAVLNELARSGGDQSFRIARRLGWAQTSVQSALRNLRERGFAEFYSYWRITPAGRRALENSHDS